MCEKCEGRGRFYSEILPGAWEVNPCQCESSALIREYIIANLEMEHQHNLRRIREAREHFGSDTGNEGNQASC